MTNPVPQPPSPDPVRWLNNQPYLLLSLTALFWAGNIVLARYVAGHVPPMTLSCVRWIGAFLMLLPFAWPHLKRDWPALRAQLPLMVVLSTTGFAFNNAISYWALQYTEALNALLIQSSGPLFVALWSLMLFGVRLSWAQLTGIAISLLGAAIYRSAQRASDPVVRAAVRGAVVADAVRGPAELGATHRHRDLAAGRAHHHPARRFRDAGRNPVQQGRPDVRRRPVRVRAVFGADAAPAESAPAVADCLHYGLRRAIAAAVLDLGIFDRRQAQIRRADGRDPDLCRDLFVDAGVPVLQSRHCADRAEPRRTIPASGARVRLGDGDPAA